MKESLRYHMGQVYRWVHRRIVYPTILKIRGEGEMFDTLQELRTLQWRPDEELRHRQASKLHKILTHAATHSRFYRELWGEYHFEQDQVWDQLRGLPIIGKKDVQESQEEMVSRALSGPVTRKTTGGSTGQAVTVLKDRPATAAERAASWLAYGWFGVEIGDRGVRFWGSPVTPKRRALYMAADLAMNRMRFSAFAFTDADLDRYWRKCTEARPDYFYGYVSMLEALANYVVRNGLQTSWPDLKAVITTAEVLTEPQRALLQDAFGVPVQNEYGCGEVGPIAYECEEGSLHLMTENQVVEVLAPDGTPAGPGETGEVILTDLNNFAMPLVRYRVGDLAMPGGACSCGRGFPVIEKVWGREYDIVQTPDGRKYHGEFFMYLFEDLRTEGRGVDQFQVVQTGATELLVKAVNRQNSDKVEVEAALLQEFQKRLSQMNTSIEWVEKIPRKSSGKTSVVENRWAERANSDSQSARDQQLGRHE